MRLPLIITIAFLSCTGDATQQTTNTQETFSSGSEPKKEEHKEEKPGETEDAVLNGCYWQILKRDTLVASLSQHGDEISGKLSFDNFEKDGSSGSVTGRSENGIIKLWYNFQSEGMNSVMEVWLKQDGDKLVRGTSEMEVKGDSSYFKDGAAVDFHGNQQMKKVACEEVPAKYK